MPFFLILNNKILVLVAYKQVITNLNLHVQLSTVLLTKSDSDVMFCLQSNQGLKIHRSLVC